VGLVALISGSRIVVIGASTIARVVGISEEGIGVTLVAFGTSLPELATVLAGCYSQTIGCLYRQCYWQQYF